MSKGSKFRSGTDLPTVAENIQTLTGQRGNGLDRAVTARELADLGLASKRVGAGGQVSLIPGVTPPPGWGGPGANKPVQYPTRPTGFTAYGAFSFIALVWDMPKYGGHTLTEVYRNSEDNLANAVLVGTEAAGVYSDPQNTGQPGAYYWIRHVNANGLPGPFNDSKGTFAQTDPNAAQNLIADRVVAGIEIITPLIRSARIENGRFTVDENGNVVATNASMNFMTANGGWFYDIYAERATFRNTLISEDCDVRGTIYANRLVGDVYNAQSGGIHIPTATPSSPWAGYFSWSSTAGEHVIWDIVGEDFDRVMDTNVTIKTGSSYRQYFTLLLRSPGHDDIEIAYKDTGNDGGGMEYVIQGVRLPTVGRDKSQQLIMRIGENRNSFVTIFTPVISGGGSTGGPEVRATSVISVYRAGRQIATSGPA